MIPLWIIDLSGTENKVSEFYDNYWNAYKTSINAENSEPWFYISTAQDFGLELNSDTDFNVEFIKQKTIDIITNFAEILTVDRVGNDRKINYNFGAIINTLNVVFIGDIQSVDTQRFFCILSTELRKNLLSNNPWTGIPNVFFYGLAFRRSNVNIGKNLSDNEKVFLHQLHNLTVSLNINIRPFCNVLFFESEESNKLEMFKSMAVTSLHIGLGDNFLTAYQQVGYDRPFLNAGISGIFFEKEVQNEREAFLLGHSLIDAFINNDSSVFYNKDNAIRYVEGIPVFSSGLFANMQIIKAFTADTKHPNLEDKEKEPEISASSWSLKQVWEKYFHDFIINLKKNLVNKLRFEILSVEDAYKEKLADNHFLWLKEKTKAIETGVFDIFKSDNPAQQCSLHQAIEVAEQCKFKLEQEKLDFNEGKNNSFIPFPLNDRHKKAYEMAQRDKKNKSEKEIMDELENKLKFHPVFLLSVFARAILIGVLLIFVGIPLVQYLSPDVVNLEFLANNVYVLGVVLALIPIIIFLWRLRSYKNQIRSLREQYVAFSLVKLNERLSAFVLKTVDDTYDDLLEFVEKWLIEKRLKKGLREQLGVLSPPDFSFEENEYFQPLLKDNVQIEKKADFLFTPERNKTSAQPNLMMSGSFNNKQILSRAPDLRVSLKNGNKKLNELNDSDKMELIRALMSEKAEVFVDLLEETTFSRMKLSSGISKNLIIDVSGSMSGDPLDQLKKVVNEFKEKFGDMIRWVAFATEARLDKDVNFDIDLATYECGGGTQYVPAFELVKEKLKQGDLNCDKLVMISDGGTCDIDAAIKIAIEIGKPVDVIYIGQGTQDHLKKLADETGGEFTAVDKVEEIEQEVRKGLEYMFALGDTGIKEFWQLLKMCNVEACARALRTFSIKKMIISDYSIENIIEEMGDKQGISEMLSKANPSCSLNAGIQYVPDLHIHLKSSDISVGVSQNNLIDNKLRSVFDITHKTNYVSPPDLLATLLCIKPLNNGLRDLAWSYNPETDKQFKTEELDAFTHVVLSYLGPDAKLVNLYGKEISNDNL